MNSEDDLAMPSKIRHSLFVTSWTPKIWRKLSLDNEEWSNTRENFTLWYEGNKRYDAYPNMRKLIKFNWDDTGTVP